MSVNPFKMIDKLYSDSTMRMYKNKYSFENPPHLYAIAESSYRNLLVNRQNQTIIITGESGAGKTGTRQTDMQLTNYRMLQDHYKLHCCRFR